jgi:hypothetical protein
MKNLLQYIPMKKLFAIGLAVAAMTIYNDAAAQAKKQCEEAIQVKCEINTRSRGMAKNDKFVINNSKIGIIPAEISKSRGVGSCYLSVENNTDMDVNVFVDSIYIGYIEPMKKGMIARSNGYQIIHCWSTEGNYKWVKKGDCVNCMKKFVLNTEKPTK